MRLRLVSPDARGDGAPQPFAFVDEVLAPYRPSLRHDFQGYRNHVQRVLHHYVALSGGPPPRAVRLAAPFHDLGIWTAGSFDYIEPSVALAMRHLEALGRTDLAEEVALLIREHHGLRTYRGPCAETVETYRRADWVDVSLGWRAFALPRSHRRAVWRAYPDAGFHRRLAALTLRQALLTPWRPLPMVHW